MEKCRHCGADWQEGHTYCPMCGKILTLTVAEYAIIRRKNETVYFEGCAKRKDIPKTIRKYAARACWEFAHWKYGYKLIGLSPEDEIQPEALAALSQVRKKAEELFELILEY